MYRKIAICIMIISIILASIVYIQTKPNYIDDEIAAKKYIIKKFEFDNPDNVDILGVVDADGYKYYGYGFMNYIGLLDTSYENGHYVSMSDTWTQISRYYSFIRWCGDSRYKMKFIIIFNGPLPDISKITLSVNHEMTSIKNVNITERSMVVFHLDLEELNTTSYSFDLNFYDSNDEIVEID